MADDLKFLVPVSFDDFVHASIVRHLLAKEVETGRSSVKDTPEARQYVEEGKVLLRLFDA